MCVLYIQPPLPPQKKNSNNNNHHKKAKPKTKKNIKGKKKIIGITK